MNFIKIRSEKRDDCNLLENGYTHIKEAKDALRLYLRINERRCTEVRVLPEIRRDMNHASSEIQTDYGFM